MLQPGSWFALVVIAAALVVTGLGLLVGERLWRALDFRRWRRARAQGTRRR